MGNIFYCMCPSLIYYYCFIYSTLVYISSCFLCFSPMMCMFVKSCCNGRRTNFKVSALTSKGSWSEYATHEKNINVSLWSLVIFYEWSVCMGKSIPRCTML